MIEIRNVSYSYYRNQVSSSLKSINLKINRGECILLCGKSGCGKTTITRLLNGIIPNFYKGVFSGSVLIDNNNIFNMPMFEISKIVGSVFQNPRTQFYTVNTSTEIAFGCENVGMGSREIQRRVNETAKELKIEHLLNKNIFMLSGGEKQIIAFASIYAMDPKVYVLDEPSSNLDAKAIMKVKRIIELLKSRGKTILIAEHRAYYLKGLIDRVIYMEGGQIVGEYSMKDISSFSYDEQLRTGLRTVDLFNYPIKETNSVKSKNILYIKNLSFSYNKKPILHIPDFKISSGRITAIVGANGSGKSTFVSCLCGLKRKVKGDFYFSGVKLKNKKRLRKSYLVMQEVNHQLFSDSVYNEIILGVKEPDNKEVLAIMRKLDILDVINSHPVTLSGGQKQRVIIASAMFCKKQVLFFDEPTSGLDFYHMIETSKLLKELKRKNNFIFIITHDYEFIASVCDDVICLEEGKIVDYYNLNPNNSIKLKSFFNQSVE